MARVIQHCPVCGTESESRHEWDSLDELYAAQLDEPEFEHDEKHPDCGGTLTYRLEAPDPDEQITAPQAAEWLTQVYRLPEPIHRATTSAAAKAGKVEGAKDIGPAWIATRQAWAEWHVNRRPAGRPTREERMRMQWDEMLETLEPHQAWEGFVGSQTPEDFMAQTHGGQSIIGAAADYAAQMPAMNDEWAHLTTEQQQRIADLLARYMVQQLDAPPTGRPRNA